MTILIVRIILTEYSFVLDFRCSRKRTNTVTNSTTRFKSENMETMFLKKVRWFCFGQISFGTNFYTLKLATQFNSENIDPSKYYNATTPVTITGATTGVKARVIGFTMEALLNNLFFTLGIWILEQIM